MTVNPVVTGPVAPAAAPKADTAAPAVTPPVSPPANTGERPAWLPAGINSPEELAKAYADLKGGKEKAPEPKPADTAADDAASKFARDAGFDPAVLSREIAETGAINAEARTAISKKLEAAGIPASMIDDYISGQKAVMDATVRDIKSIAGGDEGWNEMCQWAKDNMSADEIRAFDAIMSKADVNTAKLTVGNLYARYKASVPVAGRRVKGVTGAVAGDVFQSLEQQVAAQSDPRYAKDPAFRAEVSARIERTIKAGGYTFR